MRLEAATGTIAEGEIGLFWLGQAGFWIETGRYRLLIDPYLSDSLARKYAGARHSHQRMMPPPVQIDGLPRPDLVLITHAHTDHMDAETLGPLHARYPDVPFVIPAALTDLAQQRIGDGARLIGVDAGDHIEPLPGVRVRAFPAAHETFQFDAAGRHMFLGYGISFSGLSLYHSGDCVPFPGLDRLLAEFAPDIALLPVNGRDAERLADGVPGNFTLDEAIALARGANIPWLLPHHFGMFAFNTIEAGLIDAMAEIYRQPALLRPRAGEWLRVVR